MLGKELVVLSEALNQLNFVARFLRLRSVPPCYIGKETRLRICQATSGAASPIEYRTISPHRRKRILSTKWTKQGATIKEVWGICLKRRKQTQRTNVLSSDGFRRWRIFYVSRTPNASCTTTLQLCPPESRLFARGRRIVSSQLEHAHSFFGTSETFLIVL